MRFRKLDSLQEDYLIEQCDWYKINYSSDDGRDGIYYLFASNEDEVKDAWEQAHKGLSTYANKNASMVKSLRYAIKYHKQQINNIEKLKSFDTNDVNNKNQILTRTHRDLRRQAPKSLQDNKDKIENLPQNRDFLIHHKNESKSESSTDINDFILVEYDKDTLNFAKSIHLYIHSIDHNLTHINKIRLYDIKNNTAIPYEVILSIKPINRGA